MAEEQVEATAIEDQAEEPQVQAVQEPEPQAQAQAAPADTTDWKAEARKWEARAKENKAKADAYDAAEEERKSDLQKATERAERLESELKALKDKQARDAAVKKAAKEYGVDEDTLSRMSGDVDENAAFLKSKEPAKPAYPQVRDNGEIAVKGVTRDDIAAIKDPVERVRARAANLKLYQ